MTTQPMETPVLWNGPVDAQGRPARIESGVVSYTALPAPAVHPVQVNRNQRNTCPQVVTMLAYEVYCALYGPQEAMVTGGCRGGFGSGELIAFLYARSFPRSEWRTRVDEAFRGMSL